MIREYIETKRESIDMDASRYNQFLSIVNELAEIELMNDLGIHSVDVVVLASGVKLNKSLLPF